jgi:hypothetical protein
VICEADVWWEERLEIDFWWQKLWDGRSRELRFKDVFLESWGENPGVKVSGSVSNVKGMLSRSVDELSVDELTLLERNSDDPLLDARECSGRCWYGPTGIGP